MSSSSTSNEQSHNHNLTSWEEGEDEDKCQLPSHIIIETVQYEDYIQQENDEYEETNNNGEMLEIKEEKDGESTEKTTIETTTAHPKGQPQVITTRSGRISKRKQISDEMDYQEDIEEAVLEVVEEEEDKKKNSAQEKQIITISIRCPQCCQMFSKTKINIHMKEEHSIFRSRCAVKDCGESFTSNRALGHHLAECHKPTTQWQCAQCPKHFSTYPLFSHHTEQHHQIGHFQCSFPACTFTGEYKRKVFNHYTMQHKTQSLKKCLHPGCHYDTPNTADLKKHQRAHLGLKPYKCKWSLCDFASNDRSATIRHVRQMHLKRKAGSNETQIGDPKEYVEVVSDLL